MLIVQDILISDDLLTEQFRCNLTACRGACCWEGDFGAPITAEEAETLDHIYPDIKPFLRQAGIDAIDAHGNYAHYPALGGLGTALLPDGACVFLTFEKNGIAKCGIERAHEAGATDFKKPISCHLYPVRVSANPDLGFEALNYDRWDICSAACTAGKRDKLPVFRFVKDALVRKYGEDFYEELEAAAAYLGK